MISPSGNTISTSSSRCVLVLVGPTASGKTSLSIKLAEHLNGEIISADSRQIYRLMDIGTAKPTRVERKRIKHYFIDELMPDAEFNAGEYGKRGRQIIDDIFRRGKRPIVVGGSGLYIRSLVDGLFDGPSADPAVRKELSARLATEGGEKLLKELRTIDPAAADTMLPTNTRRIVRALEVYTLTGTTITEFQAMKMERNFFPLFVGLQWDRTELYNRINMRVDDMISAGLVAEVDHLRNLGYTLQFNALQTVGYKEGFEFLAGVTTHERMVELIKQNSRRYAKRQMTWFRSDGRIEWMRCSGLEEGDVLETILQHHENFCTGA